MATNRLICPWGRRNVSLGKVVLTMDEKTWLIHEVVHHGVEATFLTEKYSLSAPTFNRWILTYKKAGKVALVRGRPSLMSSPVVRSLKVKLNDEVYNQKVGDFEAKIQEEHVASIQSRLNVHACSIKPMSKRSIDRLTVKMGLKTGNAEQTTNARAIACADKRNAVSTAVAHSIMMPMTSIHLSINADGTSFNTAGQTTSSIKVIFDPEEQKRKGGPLKVMPQRGTQLTGHFVKYYGCVTAGGMSGAPIYIVADNNMKNEEIDVYEVAGLGLGTEVNNVGYVVFAKTRTVNEEFYRWWFTDIFIKFTVDLRLCYDIGLDVPVYFNLDGEDVQLKPLRTPDIIKLCEDHNIIIGKPPSSTTSTTQALDAGPIFLAAKTKKKHLKNIEDILEIVMTNKLTKIFKNHEEKVGRKMIVGHIKSGVQGIQVVQYLFQCTLRKDMIVESFEITGQYNRKTGKCDVEQILKQCKSIFTVEEVTRIWELLPNLMERMMDKGELDEADYDCLGLSSSVVPGQKSKDDLVLNRRRYVFLTNPTLIQKENQKRLDKANAASVALDNKNKRKLASDARKLNPPVAKRAKKNAEVVAEIIA
jgi:hypothetical protein